MRERKYREKEKKKRKKRISKADSTNNDACYNSTILIVNL